MAGVVACSSSTVSFLASLDSQSHKECRALYSSSLSLVSSQRRELFVCGAKKKVSFTDQILDYIEGGPKLRKWYGAPELLPKDGSVAEDEDEDEDEDDSSEGEEMKDAVLVTDGDSEMGQMVILSLIVKRARVKALVKDKRAALEAYGTYVESMTGDSRDKLFARRALRGVSTVICPTEGFLSTVGSFKGVKHVILLSQLSVYRGASGIQALMKSNARKLAEQDESILASSGIPYTIIRAGSLQNSPGGTQGFIFEKGSAVKGTLSKEDAAFICVEAVDAIPEEGFIFEVVNGDENVLDWKERLNKLMDELKIIQEQEKKMGVVKEVLRAGKGPKPVAGQKVTVHCTGYGKNGDLNEKFWSTKDFGQKPFSFKIGQGSVIKGWDEGVLGMQLGEVARLQCSPDYAYGSGGFPAWGIQPNSVLVFEIELLSMD